MRTLVTGSAGHLGEALVLTLRERGEDVVGIDLKASPFTDVVGSVTDTRRVAEAIDGVDAVLHAATLHKPHIVTHDRQDFVDTNIAGTLALLGAAQRAGVERFVFVSTTSVLGHAMRPGPSAPAVWVNEELRPVPRNIYGVTKNAAEDLCELAHRRDGMPVLVLRTSRFFPEVDDDAARRTALADGNLKTVEYLHRRVDVEDVVDAVLLARDKVHVIGFDRLIVSAASPFRKEDLGALRGQAPDVLAERMPGAPALLEALGWSMLQDVDRIYDSSRARQRLGWTPRHDFMTTLRRAVETGDWRSPLARRIGHKGYHDEAFDEGPYPVEE